MPVIDGPCAQFIGGFEIDPTRPNDCQVCAQPRSLHTGAMPKRVKRGYSTDFKPHGTGRRYLLDGIPAGLWTAVKKKAKREGVSVRALILQLLSDWIKAR